MIDRSTLLAVVLIVVAIIVTILVYRPGLSGPLFLDDVPQLQGLIEQSADEPATLFNNHVISSSGPFGRPVAMATFVASAAAHGPDIWWWKYQNVMLHLIGGLLVFWFTALLFRATARSDDSWHWLVGAVAAAFWLLHPLHISTVLYTVQRMTELSALFVLAGLIAYIKGRERQLANDAKGWLLVGVSLGVFFPLAVLSKESALLFPVYLSLIEILVFRFEGAASSRTPLKALHGAIGVGCLLAVVYVVANFSTVVLDAYAVREFGLAERVYTELRVIVLYLSQLLLPVQSKMGFFHDDITLSASLFDPITTLASAVFLLALAGSALKLWRQLPLFSLGVLFFFVSHSLESSIFPLELVFEHRNYLASIGIVIAVVSVLRAIVRNPRGLALIVIIGLSGFSFLTWQRAITWGSPDSMYQFMYYAHPQSSRLNLIFANIYTKMENYEQARKSLATMTTETGPAVHELFLDCVQYGQVEEDDVRHAAGLAEGWVNAHVTSSIEVLAQASLDGKCSVATKSLIALIDHLLTLPARTDIDKQSLLISKARILDSEENVDAAVAVLQSAHELRPESAITLYLAAHSLSLRGRLDEAAEFLSAAYQVERTGRVRNREIARTVYLNVGRMQAAEGQLDKALAVFSEAISSNPKEPLFYLDKAGLLIQQRRFEEARKTLAAVRSLDENAISQYEYDIRRLERYL